MVPKEYHPSTATSDISKMVMEKIKTENKWSFPEYQQNKKKSLSNTKVLSSSLIIVFLLVIAMSFIVVPPNQEKAANDFAKPQELVTLINATAFAKSLSNIDFTEINEGMVASIGEPAVYDTTPYNWFQILIILIILGSSMIILFISWLSREENQP